MNYAFAIVLLVISTMTFAGCEVIGTIFEAGVWVGVILVVLVIGLVVWLFSKRKT